MTAQTRLTDKKEYLKNVKLFASLSDQQIEKIIPEMGLKEIKSGEVITKEGDSDNTVFVLIEGEVEISKSLVLPEWMKASQKQEKSLIRLSNKHHPFFGEMAMFEEKPERSATIRATKSCLIATLSKDKIETVVSDDPEIGMIIYRNIAGELVARLVRANKDILKLTTAFTLALEG